MSIVLKKVSKNFNSTIVLSDVNIVLNVGEKIALVGENGAGKTTILKLCAGIEDPSSGSLSSDPHTLTCYVPQEFPLQQNLGLTGLDYVYQYGGDNLLRGVKRLLNEFEADVAILDSQLSALSGGQQKILDICTSLAQRPQYFLIDEPENHLDIFARQVLIGLIKNFRGCAVFVSHDQELINSLTNRIIEVDDGTLKSYTGTYEFYLGHKSRMEQGKARAWKGYEKKVDQLDKLIKRMREWVKKNPDLGAQLSARKTQLRHLQENAPEKPKSKKAINLGIGEVEQKNTKQMIFSKNLGIN
ncbi:MAG: ATP-binding cassette domain-containing protein, partial [bacterium]